MLARLARELGTSLIVLLALTAGLWASAARAEEDASDQSVAAMHAPPVPTDELPVIDWVPSVEAAGRDFPTWSLPRTRPRLAPPPRDQDELGLPTEGPLVPADGSELDLTPSGRTVAGLPIPAPARVPVPQVDNGMENGAFNNACKPPRSWKDVNVPKSLQPLLEQTGEGFQVARRGPFLIASDLVSTEFSALVDGVVACCRASLTRDYFKRSTDQIITIYAFRDKTSYEAGLRRLFGMAPISPYGHYGHSQRYIVVNYDTGPGTLVHELTHALMAVDFPEAPIWISEGIASLYEQCRVEDKSLKGEDNWRLPELKAAAEKKTLRSLAALLAMPPKEFRAKGESLHYSQSRYFCKFMEERGILRKVYHQFRDAYEKDPTGVRFVEEAFGKDLDKIEADWHSWLNTQTWE